MERKKIIIGNWKMNNGPEEGQLFLKELNKSLKGLKVDLDYVIAPPFITIPFLTPKNKKFKIPLAVQNFYFQDSGAFTGEVSLKMLEDIKDVKYALIGHSERRYVLNETDEVINKKLHHCLKTDIIPVFIFGETLEEYQSKKTKEVIELRLKEGLKKITKEQAKKIVFAYEPIWSIGTGKSSSKELAQESIAYSRNVLKTLFGKSVSDSARIMYGGSVNSENIKDYFSQKDIDGALVGGQSLTSKSFLELIQKTKN